MVKKKEGKELPKGKPRKRANRSSSSLGQRNIDEHEQQTRETLRQSEEHYRTLAEQSLMGLAIIQDFHIIFANNAFAEIYGYTIDELLSLRPEKVGALVHPEDQALVWGRFRDRLAGKAVPPRYEFRGICKNGTIRWLEVHANRIEHGGKYAIQGAYIDITEYKQAEEALRKSEEKYRKMFEGALDAIFIGDVETGTIIDCNRAACELMGADRSELIGKHERILHSPEQADGGFSTTFREHLRAKDGKVLETQVVTKKGQIKEVAIKANILEFEGKKVLQAIFRDITERKQATEALQKSEERYRQFVDNAGEAILVVQDNMIRFANPKAAELSGYSIEEFASKPFIRFIHPDDIAMVADRYMRRLKGEPVPQIYEFRIIRKDGETRWSELNAVPISWEDRPAVLCFMNDITERKKTQEALRQSEERYRTMLEEMEEGYYEVDLEGAFTFVNDAMSRILGYSRDELIGMSYKAYTPQESTKAIFQKYNRVYRTGEPLKWYPMPEFRKDGRLILAEDSVFPLRDEKGEVIGFRGISRDVTERKKAEEALRQSEERYRTILEEMGDGYFETDLAGNITFANDAMIHRSGYSKEELIGMDYRALRSKEEAKAVFDAYNRMYKTGEPFRDFSTEIICKDGTHIFAETSAFPIRNDRGEIIGFRGIRRDITERKQAEKALRQSEERYRVILEEMQDSYSEVDLGGHLTFINTAGSRHLGYSREELKGMSYKKFTAEDYIKPVFQTYSEVYRTGVPNKGFHWKIICKDGSTRVVDASVSPLRNDKGEIIGFSSVGRDVTERTKMEEQLMLTDRLASVGQLAAGIAHELNNPLTGVIGFSDLLLERDLPADVKEDLETVNQEAKRAVNVVKGLLAFAREQRTEKTLVNINAVIQGVLQIRAYEQKVSNIEVDARLVPALPQVMGNGVQLQQVFVNIIVNAEQAMTEAHGRGRLTVVTEQVGDTVRASITDDGPGISPANMKQLFTPFFTTREVGKGTGLGLSICHGIVTEHGGKLYAESELGKGATFVVELPIVK